MGDKLIMSAKAHKRKVILEDVKKGGRPTSFIKRAVIFVKTVITTQRQQQLRSGIDEIANSLLIMKIMH